MGTGIAGIGAALGLASNGAEVTLVDGAPGRAPHDYLVPGDTPLPGPTISFFAERLGGLQGPLPPMFVTLNPPIGPPSPPSRLCWPPSASEEKPA